MRVALLALALIAPAANAALVTYDYVGAEYDYIATGEGVENFDDRWLNGSQNRVTGWITLDTDQLGGSIDNVTYSGSYLDPAECVEDPSWCLPTPLHSWSFSDGGTTNGVPGGSEFFIDSIVQFATDGSGNLLSWFFDFMGDPDALIVSSTRGDIRLAGRCSDDEGGYVCASSSQAGTWTRRDVTPVPEPSAFGLMAAVLGALAVVRRRELKAALKD